MRSLAWPAFGCRAIGALLAACLILVLAGSARAAAPPPTLVEPAAGASFPVGTIPSFVVEDPTATTPNDGPSLVVSNSPATEPDGRLSFFGAVGSASAPGGNLNPEGNGRWRWTPDELSLRVQAVSTYYWMASRSECSDSGCIYHNSELRSFSIVPGPPPPMAPYGRAAAQILSQCVFVWGRAKSVCVRSVTRRAQWSSNNTVAPLAMIRANVRVTCYAGDRGDGTAIANSYLVRLGTVRKRVCSDDPAPVPAGESWTDIVTLEAGVKVRRKMNVTINYFILANGVSIRPRGANPASWSGRFSVRSSGYIPDRSHFVLHWQGTDAFWNVCIRGNRDLVSSGGRLYCSDFVSSPASVRVSVRRLR